MSVTKRGSVASMINNFHKMEYESGRMDQPVGKKSKQDLKSDNPAQKPKGDRPVPFHERPQLRHQHPLARTPSPRMQLEEVDLRRYTPSPSPFDPSQTREFPISNVHDHTHHKQDSPSNRSQRSPFPRRNSNTSSISSTLHPQYRESISHRAFERVRTASPPISMPVPRIDVSPWHETAEQYITRKLTERWSPPSSRSASVSAYSGVRRSSGGTGRSHIDAEDVQDVLGSIEEIIHEHTKTLGSVIDDSRKMLKEREVMCYEDDAQTKVEEWHSQNSSVPDLISAIDRTADHLGIRLPEYLDKRQARAVKEVRALTPISPRQVSGASSPLWGEEYIAPQNRKQMHHGASEARRLHPYQHERHGLSTIYSATDLESHASIEHAYHHHAPPPSPGDPDRANTQHSHDANEVSQHHDRLRPQASSASSERYPSPTPSPHSYHASNHRRAHGDTSNPFQDHSGSTPPIYQSFERAKLANPTPSPPLVEYDRFAALADRASRNSIVEMPDSRKTSLQLQRKLTFPPVVMGTEVEIISDHTSPAPEPVPATASKTKVGDTWMRKVNDEKGKFKRVGTMDKLKEKVGYESAGKKKFKQLPSEPETEAQPNVIRKIKKRETGKMMDSILTRQGRDKEKMKFTGGSGRK